MKFQKMALTLALGTFACGAFAANVKAPAAAEPAPAPAPAEEKPLKIQVIAQDAPSLYSAQLLGEMDRPVGDAIKLKGATLPARVDAKGQLELDVKGDGKFKVIAKQDVIPVTLKGEGDKPKTLNIKLQVFKKDDTWVYRNVTQLLVRIESEQFVIIDANGDGIYNVANVDGLAWENEKYLFPLPTSSERWCSPTQDFSGLTLGPWGENPEVKGKPLATTVSATLALLKGVNEERVKIGLTPRPEDPKLSADLQKHCVYETGTGQLAHGEEKGKSGYSPEGEAAGMRSILSAGQPAGHVAAGMVMTYFHRQDVLRPNTVAFGVGYEGRFGGIDGRTNLSKPTDKSFPVVCPVPGQTGVGLHYGKEAPDACPGDALAGYPITVYFNTSKLKLTGHSLKAIGPASAPGQPEKAMPKGAGAPEVGAEIDCYEYDPKTGASAEFTGFQQCVAIIPKDPLKANVEYEVTMKVDVDGKPWTKTWRFSTNPGTPAARPKPPKKQ